MSRSHQESGGSGEDAVRAIGVPATPPRRSHAEKMVSWINQVADNPHRGDLPTLTAEFQALFCSDQKSTKKLTDKISRAVKGFLATLD